MSDDYSAEQEELQPVTETEGNSCELKKFVFIINELISTNNSDNSDTDISLMGMIQY